MKTTIDIAEPLLRDARKLAAREGTTLRALVEQGLRQVVATRSRPAPYRVPKTSVGGRGLRPELREAGWDRIRNLIYGMPDE
jgi:hypothetical protein